MTDENYMRAAWTAKSDAVRGYLAALHLFLTTKLYLGIAVCLFLWGLTRDAEMLRAAACMFNAWLFSLLPVAYYMDLARVAARPSLVWGEVRLYIFFVSLFLLLLGAGLVAVFCARRVPYRRSRYLLQCAGLAAMGVPALAICYRHQARGKRRAPNEDL